MQRCGITLSNGHFLEYVAASGAYDLDGRGYWFKRPLQYLRLDRPNLFTRFLKTITEKPLEGNYHPYWPFSCIRLLPDGVLNAYGLRNPGFEVWERDYGSNLTPEMHCGGSITGTPAEVGRMAHRLNHFPLVAVEVNASCPNTEANDCDTILAMTEAAVRHSRFPCILKLSVMHDASYIVPRARDMVEAFSINSVPWTAYSVQPSPLSHLGGGGVSGKAAQELNWKLVSQLVGMGVPVIGPSVWEYADIARLRCLGARAISFGSLFLRHPTRPTAYVLRDMAERGITTAPAT